MSTKPEPRGGGETRLKGRWAMVTGATSGFGEATARRLAAEGCHVAVTGRRAERLDSLARDLRAAHPVEVIPLRFDVRDRGEVDYVLAARGDLLGRLDVLVNNAGLALALDPIQKGDPEDWDRMIDTNIKGILHVSRVVLPGMVERGRGHVVNIGSIAGHQVYPGGAVYAATKFAVRAISDAMRHDVIGSGVRVTNVEPGLAETEFSEVRFGGDRTRAAAVYEGMTPLSAVDVAETILWCLTRPAHVNVQSVMLLPTDQVSALAVHRRKPAERSA
jgi:3-hydroxy acid dehydrogenase / malonic semialdehyde reductase